MDRKRYREYLKCSEKKIPERSWRRYRNESGESQSDISCSTDLEMAAEVCEIDPESETEGNLTVFLNARLSRGDFDIKKQHLSDIQVSGRLAPKSLAPNR